MASPPPPIEFSTLSFIISSQEFPRVWPPPYRIFYTVSIEYNNNLLYTRSFCPRVWPPPPIEFSTLSFIISSQEFPRVWPPPYRIFYTVSIEYNNNLFIHQELLWPPPHRIFYPVIYNLFSGVSAPGASVLGYGLPPI